MDPIRSVYEADEDMLELIREFADELPGRAEALEECFQSTEFVKLQSLAHQLKGAGGGYGFDPITDAAGELERSLKEADDASLVKERVAFLCQVLRAVVVPEQS